MSESFGGQRVPEVSLVIPAFEEVENLEELTNVVTEVLAPLGLEWELLLIDDGSRDGTWSKIVDLNSHDGRIKGLRLSRNFGHQAALLAGLSHARGRAVVSMDADLQHPPAILVEMIRAWRGGSRIVHTIRIDDEETSFLKRATSRLFYRVYSALTGIHLENGMADFRLIDRGVLETLLQFPEERVFLRGLIAWVGLPSTCIHYKAGPRFRGTSKFTFGKMARLAWSGISTFTILPLRLASVFAFLMAMLAFIYFGFVIWARLFTELAIPGWASVIGVLLLLFSILFILIGILGEYIGRILTEVQQRPRYIASEQVGLGSDPLNDGRVARLLRWRCDA